MRGALKGLTGAMEHIERLETGFFQIGSAFSSHREASAILEVITRESLHCLRANRSTIFLMDPKNENLQAQFTHAISPRYQQVGIVEERETAKKALKQKTPFLLEGPEDFSDFFKYEERENKITSLMSIPLFCKGKGIGVLSMVLINESYRFDEKSLRFLSTFANLSSTALEMANLLEEAQMWNSCRITYEQYLDKILTQLQGLSEREQQRINTHIVMIQAEQKVDEKEFLASKTNQMVPWVRGAIILEEESGINRRKDERIEVPVHVEFDEEYWGVTKNLSIGGAFVLTPEPMDLGDEFLLELHILDGGERIPVRCKVVWANKYGTESRDLRRGMGVKFLSPQEKDQKRIEEYIKDYKAKNLVIKN